MQGDFDRKAIRTDGPGNLPRPNRTLTELAREAARCARPLLPEGAGMFMGLETNAEGELRLLWWRHRDFRLVAEISAGPDGFCAADSEEGALQDAAAALLDYLAGRWPSPPEELGVITDGVGIAFAPDHPAPSANGWLLRIASGESTLAMILDLDETGPCALLGPQRSVKSLH